MKSVIQTLLLIYIFQTSPLFAAPPNELKMGIVPYKSPREIVGIYSPVASLLTKQLGVPVRVVTAIGFNQYMQRIYNKQYDIIVLGSTFYFKAHERAGYEAVARGYPPFRCGIIVRKDSGIHDLKQLQGKRLAAVNIMDRGGYKLQERALRQIGLNPETDLELHFRGKHDAVIYAVLNGEDDAGAIRLDTLQKPIFESVKDKLDIVYVSPENPQFPFAVKKDMDPALRRKIGDILCSITMNNPQTALILERMNIKGIEEVTPDDLELLRQKRQMEAKEMGELEAQ